MAIAFKTIEHATQVAELAKTKDWFNPNERLEIEASYSPWNGRDCYKIAVYSAQGNFCGYY